ncbi:aldo/keto reductase [Halobium salinum]|uniref:Aldo/keto reductase n=1 Tax=Halobium salinum TaxID=1364940 RepID=A0ABD5P9T0_9EURY|nr:aldo/keto reductase [Halobium salinum]
MYDLPPVGLGTMGLDGPTGADAVATALDLGYRHLDTAQIYDNESVVGDGLAASSVPREDVLLATKVWADSLSPATTLRESVEASLDRLGVDAVDLLYVHRPIETYDPEVTLPVLDEFVDDGRVGAVGVSNFTVEELDEVRELLDSPLGAHQTEYHPLFQRPKLVEHAREGGYPLVAYSPLAGGRVFDVPELTDVAEKHDTTEAAVSIAWLAGLDVVVTIPKASSRAHLEANLAAAELELDDEDVAAIEAIDREEELFPE